MRVILKNALAMLDESGKLKSYTAGSVVDLAEAEAQRMLNSGRATVADSEPDAPAAQAEAPKRGRRAKGS
jgi:hypothetical protein